MDKDSYAAKLPLVTSITLVIVTATLGLILSSSPSTAVTIDGSTAHVNASVTVGEACTISGTGMNSHTATIANSTYQANIGETTIKVTCNDANGFAVYAIGYTGDEYEGANHTKLVGASTGQAIATGTATSGNTSNWAMKLSAVSGTYAPTITTGFSDYHQVPDTYTKVVTKTSGTDTGASATGSSFTTTYAAYISKTQAADTYNGKVKYRMMHPSTASAPNPLCEPYVCMQDVDSWGKSLNIGDEITATDLRDGKTYTVARLADGKIWMTSNLNLAGGTALSADDTDVDASYISSFSTSNNLTKSGSTIVLPASSQSGFDTNNYSYVYNSASTDCSSSTGCYGYYSWDAATLGSGRSINTDNTNAPYSICPKGWKLPTTYDGSGTAAEATDLRALMIAFGGSNSLQEYTSITSPTGATMSTTLQSSPNNFLLAGRYYAGSFYHGGSNGDYWSATTYSSTSYARDLYFYSSYVSSANGGGRSGGRSVRCLFEPKTMQNVTSSDLASMMPNVGDTTTLPDARDGQTYTIGKLADGNYWMLDNLALDITDSTVQTNLTSSATNASDTTLNYLKGTSTGTTSDKYPTAAVSKTWTSNSQNYYSVPMIAVDSTTSGPCNNAYCVNGGSAGSPWSSTDETSVTINGVTSIAQGKIGIYYNYCAASAGSYCWGNGTSDTGSPTTDPDTSTVRDVTEDICPAGWRLPTSSSTGEFQALYTAYSSNVTNLQSSLSTPLSGYFSSGKAYDQGNDGYFWSSTWNGTRSMYYLYVGSSDVNPSSNYNRYRGLSVRCILSI